MGKTAINSNAPEVLTLNEAAKVLRISKPSLSRLIKSGKLRAAKVGRRVLISKHAIAEFLGDAK